ncbi:unnamed protein product [Acanthoscelides obtectus]|uniref:Uncharacterized protein n=1 Tax=Acanthoscelides obtectus TaxID=200917 RepID=A0A9P0M100_ACAOB|nr:unnamed protein product [Acanthoscelides obtectus]CAK1645589.1 hypothetical protein AOBTE_LOCUS14157 [Acanthoscelides obtectus]
MLARSSSAPQCVVSKMADGPTSWPIVGGHGGVMLHQDPLGVSPRVFLHEREAGFDRVCAGGPKGLPRRGDSSHKAKDEGDDDEECRNKKRCMDRYDSSESSDSLAVVHMIYDVNLRRCRDNLDLESGMN